MQYDIAYGVSKIKTKTFTLLAILGLLLGAGGILMALQGSANAATLVTVTGNTSAGENQPGWLFNRDLSTSSPYEFNTDAASIGAGSLYVEPITNTGNGNSDKFIAENFINTPVADVDSISYDFQIENSGAVGDYVHFYMNVYANFGESNDLKFYDCRYNIVPTSGSIGSFTTVSFDPTMTYPVTQHASSPHTCPAAPADMDLDSPGSNIRVFALNVGDTSGNDLGLSGYLDNVVVTTTADMTTYDLEPRNAKITSPTAGSTVYGMVNFTAYLVDDDPDAIQWAVRQGTCAAGVGTVFGNVDGHSDVATIDTSDVTMQTFDFTADMSALPPGSYCFVYNPVEDGGEANIRLTSEFTLLHVPSNKDACKKGGWSTFTDDLGNSFKNQGDCVSYVATGGKNKADG